MNDLLNSYPKTYNYKTYVIEIISELLKPLQKAYEDKSLTNKVWAIEKQSWTIELHRQSQDYILLCHVLIIVPCQKQPDHSTRKIHSAALWHTSIGRVMTSIHFPTGSCINFEVSREH